jgi:hypothetical protein
MTYRHHLLRFVGVGARRVRSLFQAAKKKVLTLILSTHQHLLFVYGFLDQNELPWQTFIYSLSLTTLYLSMRCIYIIITLSYIKLIITYCFFSRRVNVELFCCRHKKNSPIQKYYLLYDRSNFLYSDCKYVWKGTKQL